MMHTGIGFSNRKMAADVDVAGGLSPVICHDIRRNAKNITSK